MTKQLLYAFVMLSMNFDALSMQSRPALTDSAPIAPSGLEISGAVVILASASKARRSLLPADGKIDYHSEVSLLRELTKIQ